MMRTRTGPAALVATVFLVGLLPGTCVAAFAAPVSADHDRCVTVKGQDLGASKMALPELSLGRVAPSVLHPKPSPTRYRYYDLGHAVLAADLGSDLSPRAPPHLP
jgi:hypothetical protein